MKCPEFTQNVETAKKWVREGCLVFGRKRHHTQGADIVGPGRKTGRGGKELWNPNWLHREFWVKVVPNVKAEYRQHVFDGLAIRRGRKVQVEDPSRKMPVRSRRNGWHLDYSDFTAPKGLRDIGKAAVKAVGYLLGAVDVLETESGELIVLEVNSAPSLKDDNTLEAYAKAAEKWAGKRD